MDDHGKNQFKPNTTVASIVHCNGKFLLVEEKDAGKTVFNQPAGHIEANENIIKAACRELKEETGLKLTPSYCSGIYYFHRPELSRYFLRFCFVFEIEHAFSCTPEDQEIIACHWLTLEEILVNKQRLRSPMVISCIEDYLSGQHIPLSAIKSNV